MQKTTESDSNYAALEKMSTADLLKNINREDKTVAHSVQEQIPQIAKLVNVRVKPAAGVHLKFCPAFKSKLPSLSVTKVALCDPVHA